MHKNVGNILSTGGIGKVFDSRGDGAPVLLGVMGAEEEGMVLRTATRFTSWSWIGGVQEFVSFLIFIQGFL